MLVTATRRRHIVFIERVFYRDFGTFILERRLLGATQRHLRAVRSIVFGKNVRAFRTERLHRRRRRRDWLDNRYFDKYRTSFHAHINRRHRVKFTRREEAQGIASYRQAGMARLFQRARTHRNVHNFTEL